MAQKVIRGKRPSIKFKSHGKECVIWKETIPAQGGKDYILWDIEVKEGETVVVKDKIVINWNNLYQLEGRSREFKTLIELATRYTIYEG
jgi:hypothetical protein